MQLLWVAELGEVTKGVLALHNLTERKSVLPLGAGLFKIKSLCFVSVWHTPPFHAIFHLVTKTGMIIFGGEGGDHT